MKKIIFVLGAVFAFGSLVAMNNPKKSLSEELTFRAQAQGQDVTCVLNDKFLDFAYENNKTLKSKDSNCFKASFIKNKESAMAKLQELGGKPVTVFHKDAPDIHCTFFDRDSKVLLVLGVGFPVQRQRMLPFVKLFLDYDLLLFDYRGIGLDHHIDTSSYFLPWKWKGLLSWAIAKVDFNDSGLGALEEKDVIAVVDAFKKKKDYNRVFGLGLCFSSYVFVKAAAARPNLFDKLLLDGSWPSVERVVKTIIKSPSLISSAENPRSPAPFLTHKDWFQSVALKLFEWVAWADVRTLPLTEYLPKLSCPILFFQSSKDCYCDNNEFFDIWDFVTTTKAVVFTQNVHGRNHVWQAEAYKEISQAFFDLDYDKFVKFIQKNCNKNQ